MNVLAILAAVALVATILLAAAIRVLREYERGVVFRLGRLMGEKGPGLVLLIPIIDQLVRVDLRTVTLNIPPQDIITRDNVPARVTAVAYFKVVYPRDAIVQIERFLEATSQIAQTTLRSVLGKAELDMLLSERERLNEALQQIIDEQTEPVGREGQHRRDQGRRNPRADAARNGSPGRGRARAPREGHQRRRRVPGVRAPLRRGADHERQPDGASAALPPDPRRARLERSLDHRVPHADRPPPPALGCRRRKWRASADRQDRGACERPVDPVTRLVVARTNGGATTARWGFVRMAAR
jgi:SPFH domain / Band 7 family